jgi:5'-methylthioadenosine phosphorylase
MLAILGGSGLTQLSALTETRRISARTAFGEPSGPLTLGRIGGREVIFLARHGDAHSIPPHQVNYRANIQALKDAGATQVASVATVGSIRREFGPGSLVVPHQIIDYTWGRASTFFEGPGAKVTHIDFTEPYAAALRARILAAAKACGEAIADGGCYGTTQGPRLETAAEIARMERDGADLVGMTAMPEASLAREAGLDYAALAVVG